MKSKGLGDTVEKITTATGIKSVVKFLFGEDCGCDERKEYLNKLWRYETPECLTEDEYNYLTDYYTRGNGREMLEADQLRLIQIHNRVFSEQLEPSNCSTCVRDLHKKMNKLYKAYESK